jgi:hypothetical protein
MPRQQLSLSNDHGGRRRRPTKQIMTNTIRTIFAIAAIAAVCFAAGCGGTAEPANTAPPVVAEKPSAPPTAKAMLELERSLWDAWKARDGNVARRQLDPRFVSFIAGKRVDLETYATNVTKQKCVVKSFDLTDEQLTFAGENVAMLSYKADQDYTCDGKKGPAKVNAAAVFVREGAMWRAVAYGEVPTADPAKKAPPAKPAVEKKEAPLAEPTLDGATTAAVAAETKVWEAWRAKDAAALDASLAPEYVFVNAMGRSDRAAISNAWTADNKCEIASVRLADAASVALAPDAMLLTYRGIVDGTCDGVSVPADWYATVLVKSGDTWKPAFAIAVPQ